MGTALRITYTEVFHEGLSRESRESPAPPPRAQLCRRESSRVKAPLPQPLSQGRSWWGRLFGFCATRQSAPPGRTAWGGPRAGRVSVCLGLCTHSLACKAHLSVCQAWPWSREGTQTPFSSDKLKTQCGSIFILSQKKTFPSEGKALRASLDLGSSELPRLPRGGQPGPPPLSPPPGPTPFQRHVLKPGLVAPRAGPGPMGWDVHGR